jgi:hypothetical protein
VSDEFDVFTSHSFSDKGLILGALLSLKDMGVSMYIDWAEDELLDRKSHAGNRESLTSPNASLQVLCYNDSSADSKWIPWELGFYVRFQRARGSRAYHGVPAK